MRASLSTWLTFASLATAFRHAQYRRQLDADRDDLPTVPSYNISMPVDHFDTNNKQTYNNRYYVNDTHYQPGGPVIVYGYGESGLEEDIAPYFLAEYNNTMTGAMNLAKQVHGLVIGWEHRYYGSSLPVPMNDSIGLTVSKQFDGGLPTDGADGYKYLSIEQAMEDLVFFANQFNQSALDNNTVVHGTANLDPYHTPWLYVGGSYSGSLAAYVRIRNPEIFYASWASSAVVEARYDGSLYYNPIYRAVPTNCSSDMKAVIKSFNDVFNSGNDQNITTLKEMIYLTTGSDDFSEVDGWSMVQTADFLTNQMAGTYQSAGRERFIHSFCDAMESFSGEAFLSNASSSDSNVTNVFGAIISNPGNGQPSDQGIVATNGGDGIRIGQAAYLFGFTMMYAEYIDYITSNGITTVNGNYLVNEHSWVWQQLTELGGFEGFNATSNKDMEIVMSAANTTALHDYMEQYLFEVYDPSVFPSQPDLSKPLKYGGWAMTPSNVMFTNGESDTWRSLSVMSEEQAVGAPKRTVTQSIPECNKPPSGTDVFGLLYGDGAGHEEDIIFMAEQHSIKGDAPPIQGANLFAKAYNAWLPCFNQSRDAVRNGQQPDGSAKSNAAANLVISQLGLWFFVGLICLSHVL